MIDPHGLPVDDFWSHSLGKSWLRGVLVAIPPSVDTFQKSIKYWKRPTTSFENFIPARRCEKFSLIREVETNGCDKENRRETTEERKISRDKKKLKLSKRHETEEERRTRKEKKKLVSELLTSISNLHQTVVNTFLIINMSNSNNLNKFELSSSHASRGVYYSQKLIFL